MYIRHLVEGGAQADGPDAEDVTPLCLTAFGSHGEIVKPLMKANPNAIGDK